MLDAFLDGLLTGLILSISAGPAFFAIIETSLENGFKAAAFMAIGIICSDILYVMIAWFGASRFFDEPKNTVIMGVVGGAILILFGLSYIIKKHKDTEQKEITIEKNNPVWIIFKGFLINMLNPFVLLFWLGMVSYTSSRYEMHVSFIYAFFAGTLSIVFGADLLKALAARSIKKILTPKMLKRISIVVGIALIALGIRLIIKVFLTQ